ncbi:MAG: hypothetical protein QF898_12285 [SAR202 cluster bacterium]|nr:hypothetical protein [SAR202 cluster bacterium]MDP6714617.1 hypothetical protein [SAR202 cluster bacterium]
MRSKMNTRMMLAFGGVITAFLVACSSATTPAAGPTPQIPPAVQPAPAPAVAPSPVATSATVTAIVPTVAPTTEPAPSPTEPAQQTQPTQAEPSPAAEGSATSFAWTIEDVGEGAKPAIALTDDGSAYVAYMLEAMPGFVKVARRDDSGWQTDTVEEGYFYGPLDLVSGPDDTIHLTYHDHEENQFQPDKGDVAYAVLENGEWSKENVFNNGHDGWDTRLFVDSNGNAHISAIDPEEFNGAGLEYYRQDSSGDWTVEQVGSGSITYKYATAVATDAQGNPHIAYYDQRGNDLALASRTDSGWEINTVDGDGSTGLFSALVIDASGRYHISYFEKETNSSGIVKYATKTANDSDWEIREVGPLDSLSFGFVGARNITSVAVDSSGNPWIAYTDEEVVNLAVWDGVEWQTSVVADSSDGSLGQIISLKLDGNDDPHLAYVEGASSRAADGVVKYATGERG